MGANLTARSAPVLGTRPRAQLILIVSNHGDIRQILDPPWLLRPRTGALRRLKLAPMSHGPPALAHWGRKEMDFNRSWFVVHSTYQTNSRLSSRMESRGAARPFFGNGRERERWSSGGGTDVEGTAMSKRAQVATLSKIRPVSGRIFHLGGSLLVKR